MKFINFLIGIIIILFTIHLNAQENDPSKLLILSDLEGEYLVYKHNNGVDTLFSTGFSIKILDYRIISENMIILIYEAPLHFAYGKYEKLEDRWIEKETSGSFLKVNDYQKNILKYNYTHSFEILDIDLVKYQYGDEEIIKDCKEFEEEKKERKRKYEEYLKNKKNN